MAAFKVIVLIFGWLGLLFAGLFILGIFLEGSHGDGFLSMIIGITWAIAYWPVTLIVLGAGFWASIWWMKQG
ncbi:hypothetical protein [Mesorhizobium sp. 113-1-2]|uniref:hypothetical protein n=1 Tax=Mesorhizobium sp. 113-1-2 TaxID=2744515 RepID=UPI001925C5F3|nr:hypothetical protein [Mesorhizobium sp. 113-1-2]